MRGDTDLEVPRPRCAVLPAGRAEHLVEAVRRGGGDPVGPEDADAVVWTDPDDPDGLRRLLDAHPRIDWVQLPFAGIEPYVHVLDTDRRWTCGKGVYAEPVAEHTLALTLAILRRVGHYARQRTWTDPSGRTLLGARVTVLGGGEITASLLRLLRPFDADVTVVRRRAEPVPGADRVLTHDRLPEALASADVVVLALALTPETEHVLDAEALATLPDHAVVVNVARGRHIDTDALDAALAAGRLAGAALDVTDPEPLPDDHPLWSRPDVVITPHTASTPRMGAALLAERVAENVGRYARGDALLGPVDVPAGY